MTNGNCTLGEAIEAANTDTPVDACSAGDGADVIILAAATTYVLTSPIPAISSSLTLSGLNSTIRRTSDKPFAVLTVDRAGSLALEGVTITGGNSIYLGGGIRNLGTLYLRNAHIFANQAPSGGGIYSSGTLFIENSTIMQNSAVRDSDSRAGVGILNEGSATIERSTIAYNHDEENGLGLDGGGIANSGVLTLTNSLIHHNPVARSGAIDNLGTMSVISSTIRDNSARQLVGGITNQAQLTVTNSVISANSADTGSIGAILNIGTLAIRNSTLSGNRGQWAGGILNGHYMGEGRIFRGMLSLEHSTIANNEAIYEASMVNAGGIAIMDNTVVTMTHTLIGGNRMSDGTALDCAGTIESRGYNLIQSSACSLHTSRGDILGVDPHIGLLGDNGGSTATHLLLPGSPAIDAGDPLYRGPLATDQRGAGFPRIANGRIDIGAVEAARDPELTTPLPLPTSTPTPLACRCTARCVFLPFVWR